MATASTSATGALSSSDKTKLDGIATSANNYSLPTATSSVLGGVKVTSANGLALTSGVISMELASTTATGAMSSNMVNDLNNTISDLSTKIDTAQTTASEAWGMGSSGIYWGEENERAINGLREDVTILCGSESTLLINAISAHILIQHIYAPTMEIPPEYNTQYMTWSGVSIMSAIYTESTPMWVVFDLAGARGAGASSGLGARYFSPPIFLHPYTLINIYTGGESSHNSPVGCGAYANAGNGGKGITVSIPSLGIIYAAGGGGGGLAYCGSHPTSYAGGGGVGSFDNAILKSATTNIGAISTTGAMGGMGSNPGNGTIASCGKFIDGTIPGYLSTEYDPRLTIWIR